MKNFRNVFIVGYTDMHTTALNKAKAERDALEMEIFALGYDINAPELADWLIEQAAHLSLSSGKTFTASEILSLYKEQKASHLLESIDAQIKALENKRLSISNTNDLDANREAMRQNAGKMEVSTYEPEFKVSSTFNEFGESVKQFTIKATEFNYEAQKAKYNDNTKWYNQHIKRRKR